MNTIQKMIHDPFTLYFLKLPKFPKTKEDQLSNIVEKWIYFFSATRKVMVLWWLNSFFPDIRENAYLTFQRMATLGCKHEIKADNTKHRGESLQTELDMITRGTYV